MGLHSMGLTLECDRKHFWSIFQGVYLSAFIA